MAKSKWCDFLLYLWRNDVFISCRSGFSFRFILRDMQLVFLVISFVVSFILFRRCLTTSVRFHSDGQAFATAVHWYWFCPVLFSIEVAKSWITSLFLSVFFHFLSRPACLSRAFLSGRFHCRSQVGCRPILARLCGGHLIYLVFLFSFFALDIAMLQYYSSLDRLALSISYPLAARCRTILRRVLSSELVRQSLRWQKLLLLFSHWFC